MSDNNSKDPSIDATPSAFEGFEISTTEASSVPSELLLAEYGNPVTVDSVGNLELDTELNPVEAEEVQEPAELVSSVSSVEPVAEVVEPVAVANVVAAESVEPVAEVGEPVAEIVEPVAVADVVEIESVEPVAEIVEPAAEVPVVEVAAVEPQTEPVAVEPVSEQASSEKTASEPTSPEPTSCDPIESDCEKSEELRQAKSLLGISALEPGSVEPHAEIMDLIGEVKKPKAVAAETSVEPAEAKSKRNKPSIVAADSVTDVSAETPKSARKTAEASEKTPTPEPEAASDTGFDSLELSADVQQAIQASGYDKPTDIQLEIVPHMLAGRDVLAQSQTGTGKTAAFALPILTNIKPRSRKPQVLVLTPTRELAIQVAKSFKTYAGSISDFAVAAIYGGQDYDAQFKQLRRGVQVVVGTPGRVIDHINRGTLDISEIDCLVLDEADEMLNMGFLEDVQFVLEKAPESRQIALFSATLPAPIRNIAQQYLKNPAKITIKTKTVTADSIDQRALIVTPYNKIDVLKRLLEVEETDAVIVFTKTKDATISVAEQLIREGLSAAALNGDMPQKVRERTIDRLKAGHLDILVATDVAARGLDVTRVSHVFNYDLPHDSESYIHRVGRTGRAGRKGEAIIFLTPSQRNKLRLIENATKQTIKVVQPPTADDINAMRVKRFQQQITDAIGDQDLTMFKKMVVTYTAETGNQVEDVAAALALLGQNGRPFFMKDRPQKKYDAREGGRSGRKGRREREADSFNQGSRRSSGKSVSRRFGPPEKGMTRYRIEVGHKDGVRPGNIVGAVANEAGIEGKNIGPIKIHDEYSTVDLPAGMSSEVCQTLGRTWVVGKQLRLKVSNEASISSVGNNRRTGNESRSYQGKSRRNDKPRSNSKRNNRGGGASGSGASGSYGKGKMYDATKIKKRKDKA